MTRWGAIADDVTGATDLAGNFAARGYATEVVFGLDALSDPAVRAEAAGIDAIVVALKSRTAPVDDAVRESLAALGFLESLDAERLYVKYCSTFDSTPRGNIGPIIDAVLAATGETLTVAVPSFPDTGRTVYKGHLFVGDELLSDSSMRFHPLTPMTESSVPKLLAPQTIGEVGSIGLETVRAGAGALRDRLEQFHDDAPTTVVVDAVSNDDLRVIAEATKGLRVVTGGSGLALGLPPADAGRAAIHVADGRRAVLCGSASYRTREQVAYARANGIPWRKLDLEALREDAEGEIAGIVAWAVEVWAQDPAATPLVYSVDDLADIDRGTATSGFHAAESVEAALGAIARAFLAAGVRQLIVAGGETSGRVISDLGIRSLRIGPALGPGVSWSEGRSRSGERVDVALKSGNFGAPDMFASAWAVLDGARTETAA